MGLYQTKKIKMIYCTEEKETLSGAIKTYQCELITLQKQYGILQYNIEKEWNIAGHLIPKNSKTIAIYWKNRDYNLYWFLDTNNQTLFYYFNIGDNFDLSPTHFRWRDLTIDIVISAQGAIQVLDEDELPAEVSEEIINKIEVTKKHLFNNYEAIIDEAQKLAERHITMN